MKIKMLIVLACTLFAVSGCVIAPYGGGGRGYYSGDGGGHDRSNYGRRVWHE